MIKNLNEAQKCVGEGWADLVKTYMGYVGILEFSMNSLNELLPREKRHKKIKVTVINNDRGMLHIEAEHTDPRVQDMLNKLAWAIERDSAKVCEVCGEKGFRRKTLPGSPNRCKAHYIELCNELADAGEI